MPSTTSPVSTTPFVRRLSTTSSSEVSVVAKIARASSPVRGRGLICCRGGGGERAPPPPPPPPPPAPARPGPAPPRGRSPSPPPTTAWVARDRDRSTDTHDGDR